MQAAIRIPEPSDNDPDSVATALETAALLVAKGELTEALRWVRRGAESASETGHDVRALALARAAAELSDHLERPSGFAPAPSSHAPAPSPNAPEPPAARSARPLATASRGPLEGKPVVSVPALAPTSGAYSVARPQQPQLAPFVHSATPASEATTAAPPADFRFDRRSAPPNPPAPSATSGSGSFAARPNAAERSSTSSERPAERPSTVPPSSIPSVPPAVTSSAPVAPTSSFPPPPVDQPSRPRVALRKTARVAVRSAGGTQYVVRTLEEDESLDPGEQEGLLVLLEPKTRLF